MSDVWLRAVIGNTAPEFRVPPDKPKRWKNITAGQIPPPMNSYLTVDAFVDPLSRDVQPVEYRPAGSTIELLVLRSRANDSAMMETGSGAVTFGTPSLFNEVYAPTKEIQFATLGGGFRTPWGWTIGAKDTTMSRWSQPGIRRRRRFVPESV